MTIGEMADLYKKGWSTRRIAAVAGRSHGVVYQRLKKFGVKMRPRRLSRRRARICSGGYVCWGKTRVHRIVCAAWHGPPPSKTHVVNHIDGDKLNNHPDNLEWVTPAENARHAFRMGLTPAPPSIRGVAHHDAKLTPDDVCAIRESVRNFVSLRSLAENYNVSTMTIIRTARGRTWRHVTKVAPLSDSEWEDFVSSSRSGRAA